jgi:hypothetical protein
MSPPASGPATKSASQPGQGKAPMAIPSWTSTLRRAAGHPAVRTAAAALLRTLAPQLTHEGTDRRSGKEACNGAARTGRC